MTTPPTLSRYYSNGKGRFRYQVELSRVVLELYNGKAPLLSFPHNPLSGIPPSSNIELLQLAKTVKVIISSLCVDISNARSFLLGSQCWVAGWGKGSKSTGGSGWPSAMQVRFILVPGGRCIYWWKQISPCRHSDLCQNFKIWVILKGDSGLHVWPSPAATGAADFSVSSFLSFFVPITSMFLF